MSLEKQIKTLSKRFGHLEQKCEQRPMREITPLFSSGFETGDFSEWYHVTGYSIISNPVHTGQFAARSTGIYPGLVYNHGSPLNHTYYLKFWIYYQGNYFPTGASAGLIWGDAYIELYLVTGGPLGHPVLRLDGYGLSQIYGTHEIKINTWHCIRLKIDWGLANAQHRVWIDNYLDILLEENCSGDTPQTWRIYADIWYDPYNIYLIVDDVIFDPNPI